MFLMRNFVVHHMLSYVFLLLLSTVLSDIIYPNFNTTEGLIFVKDAGSTNCHNDSQLIYGDVQYKADDFNDITVKEIAETTDFITERTIESNIASLNAEIQQSQAGFLHRNDTISAPVSCSQRVRLTPSSPSKTGAVWYRDKRPVVNGFDTYFTFQISDHSKECILVKDQYFSKYHHRTCNVHGADGFAMVIHNSVNGTNAIGRDGGQMGFGGIDNSLAIAFDTWTNPGQDTMFSDHISIQSRGLASNDGLESALLGLPRPHPIADGHIHTVRVTYHSELKPEYFTHLVASASMIPYLKDNGEQKRIGTLLIYIDDGIASDTPILALPINLSLLLRLDDDKAYIGFTSSTGRFYEKHDILSWMFCDEEHHHIPSSSSWLYHTCDDDSMRVYDYHDVSRHFTAMMQRYDPGGGYGGGYNKDGFPIKNQNPNTAAVGCYDDDIIGHHHDRIGLAGDADQQVPPHTLY